MIQPDRVRSVSLVLILALGAVLTASPAAQAQTPAATVKDDGNNVVFQSFAEGQLYAPGPSDSGAIPKEGGGTRLLWWPKKAAFRAGKVGGSQWNASNIESYSVAFGFDTKASGYGAVAMGNNTTAKSKGAVAMGNNTTAKSAGTVAMGGGTTAGNDNSGPDAAENAVAMGYNTTASGRNAVAMGNGATASGEASTAMGVATTANGLTAVAMGILTTASGFESFAMGRYAAAEDGNSFVWNDGSSYHDVPNVGTDGLSSRTAVNGEPVTGSRTFSVSAQGGVRFVTGSSQVTYIEGGTTGWSTTSTRAAKTNITPAGPTAVLAAVKEMPISTWEYKTESGEGAGTRHIGPMAEDFHGALPYDLGSSKDHINAINADGVALGAIQGLAQKVEAQKKRIAALESQNETMKRKQQEFEKRLAALEAERSSTLPAGWGLSGLLALLVGLGGLGAGLLWRRR